MKAISSKEIGATLIVVTWTRPATPKDKPDAVFQETLLGLKPKNKKPTKRQVAVGKWTPAGGKRKGCDKSAKHCAQRELLEEMGISTTLGDLVRVGQITGYLKRSDASPMWQVAIYTLHVPYGTRVTFSRDEYLDVQWFPTDSIPYSNMLKKDAEWLPKALAGEKIKETVYLDEQ